MDKILAKQVENVVDTDSQQQVTGRKTFMSDTIFDRGTNTHHMVLSGGFIYWVADATTLDFDGNYRMGIIDGTLASQQYIEGAWTTV